jgi:hypothetical protein
MTTAARLVKHYPRLTADERLALTLAAAARGDGAEVGRVAASSPRRPCTAPDLYLRVRAFTEVSYEHAIRRLETSVQFMSALLLSKEADPTSAALGLGLSKLFAFQLACQSEGWTAFCAARRLDPQTAAFWAAGGRLSDVMTALATGEAFTEGQAREYHAAVLGGDPGSFRSAADLAAELEGWYADRLVRWG